MNSQTIECCTCLIEMKASSWNSHIKSKNHKCWEKVFGTQAIPYRVVGEHITCEIESILDHKLIDDVFHYLIKFVDYSSEYNEWIAEHDCDAVETIQRYWIEYFRPDKMIMEVHTIEI